MDFGKRFKNGLYMATHSFSMVWHQKKLLLYFGIPACVTFLFRLLFNQESFQAFYHSMPSIIRAKLHGPYSNHYFFYDRINLSRS